MDSINFHSSNPCGFGCMTCDEDLSVFGCTSCRAGFISKADGRCVCPDGSYIATNPHITPSIPPKNDEIYCASCDYKCEICYGSGTYNCIKCSSGFVFYFGECIVDSLHVFNISLTTANHAISTSNQIFVLPDVKLENIASSSQISNTDFKSIFKIEVIQEENSDGTTNTRVPYVLDEGKYSVKYDESSANLIFSIEESLGILELDL